MPGSKKGITYYSEFRDNKSIINPLVDNKCRMLFRGHFMQDWNPYSLTFPDTKYGGYGLRRTQATRGTIFCNDASKLFSFQQGYIGITLKFPYQFSNGVYAPLEKTNQTFFLFGANVGNYDIKSPGISAFLTPDGIKYTIWTSAAKYEFVDNVSAINANEDVFIELFWMNDAWFTYYGYPNVVVRVNGVGVIGVTVPIGNDNLSLCNFYVLDTPLLASQLDCTIKELIISNELPKDLADVIFSSSSTSWSSASVSFSSQSSSNSTSSISTSSDSTPTSMSSISSKSSKSSSFSSASSISSRGFSSSSISSTSSLSISSDSSFSTFSSDSSSISFSSTSSFSTDSSFSTLSSDSSSGDEIIYLYLKAGYELYPVNLMFNPFYEQSQIYSLETGVDNGSTGLGVEILGYTNYHGDALYIGNPSYCMPVFNDGTPVEEIEGYPMFAIVGREGYIGNRHGDIIDFNTYTFLDAVPRKMITEETVRNINLYMPHQDFVEADCGKRCLNNDSESDSSYENPLLNEVLRLTGIGFSSPDMMQNDTDAYKQSSLYAVFILLNDPFSSGSIIEAANHTNTYNYYLQLSNDALSNGDNTAYQQFLEISNLYLSLATEMNNFSNAIDNSRILFLEALNNVQPPFVNTQYYQYLSTTMLRECVYGGTLPIDIYEDSPSTIALKNISSLEDQIFGLTGVKLYETRSFLSPFDRLFYTDENLIKAYEDIVLCNFTLGLSQLQLENLRIKKVMAWAAQAHPSQKELLDTIYYPTKSGCQKLLTEYPIVSAYYNSIGQSVLKNLYDSLITEANNVLIALNDYNTDKLNKAFGNIRISESQICDLTGSPSQPERTYLMPSDFQLATYPPTQISDYCSKIFGGQVQQYAMFNPSAIITPYTPGTPEYYEYTRTRFLPYYYERNESSGSSFSSISTNSYFAKDDSSESSSLSSASSSFSSISSNSSSSKSLSSLSSRSSLAYSSQSSRSSRSSGSSSVSSMSESSSQTGLQPVPGYLFTGGEGAGQFCQAGYGYYDLDYNTWNYMLVTGGTRYYYTRIDNPNIIMIYSAMDWMWFVINTTTNYWYGYDWNGGNTPTVGDWGWGGNNAENNCLI